MLTDAQKKELTAKLTAEKAELEEQLGKLGSRNPSNQRDWVASIPKGDEFGADRTDNAGVIETEQQNYATLNELEGRLNTVLSAIERMNAGTYGMCIVGNEPIQIERLMANPAAQTCMVHLDAPQP